MTHDMAPQRYARAQEVIASRLNDCVLNGNIKPHWYDGGRRYWYIREEVSKDHGKSKCFTTVDPTSNIREPAFDHERLARSLSQATGENYTAGNLPFDLFTYQDDKKGITFSIEGVPWYCHLDQYSCATTSEPAYHELPSPDGKWVAYVEMFNLFVREQASGAVIQLTDDGIQHNDYASHPETRTTAILEKVKGVRTPPAVLWSPDSKKLLTYKLNQQQVKNMYLLQSVTETDDVRPVLHTYKYSLVGDEHLAKAHLVVFHVQEGRMVWLDYEPLEVNFVSPLLPMLKLAEWVTDSTKVCLLNIRRDHKNVKVILAEADTGSTRLLLEEQSDTFFNFSFHPQGVASPQARYLANHTFIWQSQRDGWSHLYLYDGQTGELINQITQGPWSVLRIWDVDEERGWLYFSAGGREPGRDPYYQHFYRIQLDGSQLTLLTPEVAEHQVSLGPNCDYFVDSYSRVDLPPVTVLRSADGQLVCELEHANIEQLLAKGYQMPQPFKVKARDGETDLYGILIPPAMADLSHKYPVIDHAYGGVQRIHTPKAFTWGATEGMDPMGGAQSLAQLGFAVILMDGMGTPFRSKAFHDICHQNLQDAAGLEDHVTGIRQLVAAFPFLDLDRVGIWGASGGGYATVRALAVYPKFYKVGVSVCGNHDQRLYIAGWGEPYQGMFDKVIYQSQDNAQVAHQVQGKLLLIHGDMDDNVHPANTMRVVDALIKANKDFDMLIMPNRFHRMGEDPYFIRRKWDYFIQHLL